MQSERVKFSDVCGFTPKQRIATRTADSHRFTLFGGFRGPGKSYWLRWHLLYLQLCYAAAGLKNVVNGLFCESYPELRDRHISKLETEFPRWMGELKSSKAQGLGFHMAPRFGGGVIALRNLDDVAKYKGAEFAGIAIDEIVRTSQRNFELLRGSLRWPGVERPQMIAATNPDGPHKAWVRKLWVERNFTGDDLRMSPLADEFAFVPATPHDNPHLSQEYWNDLLTAPADLRDAWLHGDWYGKAHGVVYDEFDGTPGGNISSDEFDLTLPYELAFDDGYVDPRVILFVQRKPQGVHWFHEIRDTRTLDETSITHVLEQIARMYTLALPEDWSTLRNGARSEWLVTNGARLPDIAIGSTEAVQLMRRFKEAGIIARGGTHDVVEGIKRYRSFIKDGRGHRAMTIHPRCVHFIDELTNTYQYPEGVRRDTEKPEDKNDHACDASRYWIWMRGKR